MALPPVTTGMVVVFALVLAALVAFVTERIPPDTTAIGILVSLAVLEPVTGVSATDAISGFASPATITILAMYILSEGVQETGIVERLGVYLTRVTNSDENRLLAATVGTTGFFAGVVNNTPVVAVFIPMVSDLAEKAGISPSKLLLPLSYAAMLGGTLTLIGTATNLLASDFAREIPGRGPIGMFEFTPLGIVVFLVGAVYLLTVGRYLTPARITPEKDLTEAFELQNRLVRLTVPEESELVGRRVDEVLAEFAADLDVDVDLLQIDRNGESFHAQLSDQVFVAGDDLTVRASLQTANKLTETYGVRQRIREEVSEADLLSGTSTVVEAVVPSESRFVGRAVGTSGLKTRFDSTVLGIIRGGTVQHDGLDEFVLQSGDTLLLHTTMEDVGHLQDEDELVVTHTPDTVETPEGDMTPSEIAPLSSKTPVAVGIMLAVVAAAALGVVPIVIAALAGVFGMVVTGCLSTSDAYDAVSWNVVFLLAGVLPLGIAMQETGGAAFVAAALESAGAVLPPIVLLALFYLFTGLLANVITPIASVVLMIPIAVDTATRIGSEPFSFLLGVTFAASSAFTTPIGYQTNLMVYGPGGYKFTDYVRVGGPLQLLLAVVVPLGIAVLYGL
jgi:di/tricarboxylate transporter